MQKKKYKSQVKLNYINNNSQIGNSMNSNNNFANLFYMWNKMKILKSFFLRLLLFYSALLIFFELIR